MPASLSLPLATALVDNDDATDFFRLSMVPGMLHCGGGPGPNAFGQSLPQAAPLGSTPRNDILSALEQWVEQGVLRTCPLCAWPKAAVYNGKGSTDDAANFSCRSPQGPHGRRDGGDDD